MRVVLVHRGFRTNFGIVGQREVQLLKKVDKFKFVGVCNVYEINYKYKHIIIFFYEILINFHFTGFFCKSNFITMTHTGEIHLKVGQYYNYV